MRPDLVRGTGWHWKSGPALRAELSAWPDRVAIIGFVSVTRIPRHSAPKGKNRTGEPREMCKRDELFLAPNTLHVDDRTLKLNDNGGYCLNLRGQAVCTIGA